MWDPVKPSLSSYDCFSFFTNVGCKMIETKMFDMELSEVDNKLVEKKPTKTL